MTEQTNETAEAIRALIKRYKIDLSYLAFEEPGEATPDWFAWNQQYGQLRAGLAEAERQLRELTGE